MYITFRYARSGKLDNFPCNTQEELEAAETKLSLMFANRNITHAGFVPSKTSSVTYSLAFTTDGRNLVIVSGDKSMLLTEAISFLASKPQI